MEAMDDGAFASGPAEIIDGRSRQKRCKHHIIGMPDFDADRVVLLGGFLPDQASQLPGKIIVKCRDMQCCLFCFYRLDGGRHGVPYLPCALLLRSHYGRLDIVCKLTKRAFLVAVVDP